MSEDMLENLEAHGVAALRGDAGTLPQPTLATLAEYATAYARLEQAAARAAASVDALTVSLGRLSSLCKGSGQRNPLSGGAAGGSRDASEPGRPC